MLDGYSYEVDEHLVGGWIWHRMNFYVFSSGHPNLPAADLVHELDANDGLLERGQNETGKLH